ncbi:MAG: methyltransferase [Betaproteobacteria bacterium]|nr:MAG: methyltransferase [Betaproteobacteria bacterium]
MNTAIAKRTDETVTAPLQFTVNDGKPLIAKVFREGEGLDERSGTFEWRDVEIHDGRAIADQLDLDREGFQLIRHQSAVSNWFDAEEVRRVGYPETEMLLKAITGCSKVVVFDHTPRIDDEALQMERALRPPAKIVHNDFIPESAEQRVRDLLPADEAEALLKKRFGSINVWRPIKGPVETAPLVICGYGDMRDEDLIISERHYPDGRIGRIYNVAYNPAQRWTYFPHMMPDEAVLLKCYDSLTDGTARWTAHGSFQPPNKPADAAPRESVELRTMIFWE